MNTWIGYYLNPAQWIESSPFIFSGVEGGYDGEKAIEVVLTESIKVRDYDLDVIVYRDGLFKFNFHKVTIAGKECFVDIDLSKTIQLEDGLQLKIIQLFNCHLGHLYIDLRKHLSEAEMAIMKYGKFTVSASDLWGFTETETGGMGLGGKFDNNFLIGRSIVQPKLYKPGDFEGLEREFFLNRNPLKFIPLEAVKDSLSFLKVVLTHTYVERLIILWGLFAKSLQSLNDADFDWCVMNAWTGIESIISDLWKRYLQNNRLRSTSDGQIYSFINSDRLKILENGTNFTASIQIEVLSLLGEIDKKEYDELSEIRKKRNSWIHNLKHVEKNDALIAINLLLKLITKVYHS